MNIKNNAEGEIAMIQLYTNIKERRKALKMSQDELAKKTGYTDRSSIAKIEKGEVDLSQSKIIQFAKALDISPGDLMGWDGVADSSIVINVYGRVAAGIPIDMSDDVQGTVEITPAMARKGEYFALQISGDSMEPRIFDGDLVIVRRTPDVESGAIAIVTINGEDATCKRLIKYADRIQLVSINPKYPPMDFSAKEVEELPIRVIGQCEEVRGSLKY